MSSISIITIPESMLHKTNVIIEPLKKTGRNGVTANVS